MNSSENLLEKGSAHVLVDGSRGQTRGRWDGTKRGRKNLLLDLRRNHLARSTPGSESIEDDNLVCLEHRVELGLAITRFTLAFVPTPNDPTHEQNPLHPIPSHPNPQPHQWHRQEKEGPTWQCYEHPFSLLNSEIL